MVCPWLLCPPISHGPEPVASVLGKTRNVLKMTFHLNLCSKLNWCFSVLFSVLQPLEMNLVELAQHNFSEPPRHPPPFRGKQQQYIFKQTKKKKNLPLEQLLWPWWDEGGREIRTRGPNCDIYSSCSAVVFKKRSSVCRHTCPVFVSVCLSGAIDVSAEDAHCNFSDLNIFYLSVSPVYPSVLPPEEKKT